MFLIFYLLFFIIIISATPWCHFFIILENGANFFESYTVNFTTIDALFDRSLQKAYTQFIENNFIFSFSHTVSEYILGIVILLPKSWVDVEHILFPVHISSQQHWILLRLSIKDWSVYVYNSFKDTHGYAAEVVKAYSVMLLIFLKRWELILVMKYLCELKLFLICLFSKLRK